MGGAGEGQREVSARRHAVQVRDRLRDPRGVRAGRDRHRLGEKRQYLGRALGVHRLRDHADRGMARVEQHRELPLELDARHTWGREHLRLVLGAEEGSIAREARPDVDIGRQHPRKPRLQRLAEGPDHNRHRHHEAEAHDDGRDARAGEVRRAAQLRYGELRTGRARQRQVREEAPGERRREPDRSEEDERDRGVTGHRQLAERRQRRQRRAEHDQS